MSRRGEGLLERTFARLGERIEDAGGWIRHRLVPERFSERREMVRRRRSATWQVIVALIAATIGAAALGYLAVQLFLLPESVAEARLSRVPDFTGKEREDAISEGEDQGYAVVESGRQYSDDVDEGEVIYQIPPPETYLQRGDSIFVLVSLGESGTVLPDLAGLEPEPARSILRQLGVEITPPRRSSSDVHAQGTVIETVPPAGTPIEEDTSVTLVLSRGGSFLTMPDVTGMRLAEARDSLEVYGLTVGEVTGADEEGATGEGAVVVVEQEPGPHRRVRAGSAVRLRLGEGEPRPPAEGPAAEVPPDRDVAAPPVEAEAEEREEARRGLREAGEPPPGRREAPPDTGEPGMQEVPVDTADPAAEPPPDTTAGTDEDEIF
ncbi:MAG: PASTA domain-containing protein [Gemmatimonadota bacterium]|nr:PASTA domain-containing protein [Gemmatimonadota bacterium]